MVCAGRESEGRASSSAERVDVPSPSVVRQPWLETAVDVRSEASGPNPVRSLMTCTRVPAARDASGTGEVPLLRGLAGLDAAATHSAGGSSRLTLFTARVHRVGSAEARLRWQGEASAEQSAASAHCSHERVETHAQARGQHPRWSRHQSRERRTRRQARALPPGTAGSCPLPVVDVASRGLLAGRDERPERETRSATGCGDR